MRYSIAMSQLILIAHNLRSSHNVGSILRTAEGLGVKQIYLTGYSPYPLQKHDDRLPHLAQKVNRQIAKTALGAEKALGRHIDSIADLINDLRNSDYVIAALEQAVDSIELPSFRSPDKLALLVGREVEGIEDELLEMCDLTLEIPMSGQKESFNVAVAAAIALYHCKFSPSLGQN